MAANRMFTALVTFEKTEEETDILPSEAQGACGYMAISATNEDELREALSRQLKEVGLRLLEVDEICEFDPDELPDHIDQHLASNIQNWEPGKCAVWGSLHVYLAEGEA